MDRSEWRRELDRRLAAGDVPGAIEALWWWFARSVAGGGVDATCTSRELVLSVGRNDLLSHVPSLDRMSYGTARPPVEEVRHFLERLEQALR
jgi:hypothetical protein